MDRNLVRRILDVEEMAAKDDRYLELNEQFRIKNEQLMDVLGTLTEEETEIILDYIYLGAQMHYRIQELACTMYSKSGTD
ncbi:MAG: hypothetical protein J6J18_12040 [Oscillospiraceae bacterium]|nr:hypothetical protein [Oscillospiraceae bacterium]